MNPPYKIVSYFDKKFLQRGRSFLRHLLQFNDSGNPPLIYALDTVTQKALQNLFGNQIEIYSHFSQKTISNKSTIFSFTPLIIEHALKKCNEDEVLLYLDADVIVYDKISNILNGFEKSELGAAEHGHPFYRKYLNKYGKYNVGVNLFRNSESVLKFIEEWKQSVTKYNFSNNSFNFISDQIFWSENKVNQCKFHRLDNRVINVAPWNLHSSKFIDKQGTIYNHNLKLLCFHFAGIDFSEPGKVYVSRDLYLFWANKTIKKLYKTYLSEFNFEFDTGNEIVRTQNNRKIRILKNWCKLFLNQKIL